MSEPAILEKVDSPHIVKMHYAHHTENKLVFLMDFLGGGNLYNYIGHIRHLG